MTKFTAQPPTTTQGRARLSLKAEKFRSQDTPATPTGKFSPRPEIRA